MIKRTTRAIILPVALRIFCAALMVSLGLSHQAVAAIMVKETAHLSEEYRLPDGSFADICRELHNASDETSNHHGKTRDRCEACILASSLLIPTADDSSWIVSSFSSISNARPDQRVLIETIAFFQYHARGPPSLY